MSRRGPRYRLDIAAKVQPLLGGDTVVCRTRDVSEGGLCLDTAAWFPPGTRIVISLFDPATGAAFEVIGDVVRAASAPSWKLGVLVLEAPAEWRALVASAARDAVPEERTERQGKRLRVLVVGDEHRQRGAMALYVTSGWDVLFASDDDSVQDVLEHRVELDAVIAELDAGDPRIAPIMENIRRAWPAARRLVRGHGRGDTGLVHRFVERDAGLPALLDAITADLPQSPS